MDKIKKRWTGYFVGLLVVLAAAAWWLLRPPGLPEGFASSNGRIEATEVDIASKIAGRIDTILVKEGQFVRQGEVLARMDTRVLNEQRLEAAAQIKEAESAVLAARALLDQRQSEMRASEAVVKQRQAELDSTAKRHVRSKAFRSAAPSPPSSWMTIAPRQRAPARRWSRRKPRSPPPAPPSRPPAPALFRRKPASKPPRRPSGGSLPILTIAS